MSFDSLWSEIVQWAEGRAVSDALTLEDTDLVEGRGASSQAQAKEEDAWWLHIGTIPELHH